MRYLIIFLVLILSSCATEKKAQIYYSKHPEKLAKECAVRFPPKEFVRDSIIIIPGKTPPPQIVKVPCPGADTVEITVPVEIVHDTLIRTRIVQVSNVAREVELEAKLLKANTDANKALQDKAVAESNLKVVKKRNLYLTIGIGASILFLIVYLYIKSKTKIL